MERVGEALAVAKSAASLMPSLDTREFKIPLPPNPIHDTNRQLGQLIGTIKDFRAAADDWTQTALDEFATNAKQGLRHGRMMIFAGLAAVLVSILVPIYLQSRAASEAARNQATLLKKVQEYVSKRDAADQARDASDRKILGTLRDLVTRQQAQASAGGGSNVAKPHRGGTRHHQLRSPTQAVDVCLGRYYPERGRHFL
jgi:hypothetical protein